MLQHTKHIVWTIALFAISTKTIPFTENKIYLFFYSLTTDVKAVDLKGSYKIKRAYLQALVGQSETH